MPLNKKYNIVPGLANRTGQAGASKIDFGKQAFGLVSER
jgi:hypothetical protein